MHRWDSSYSSYLDCRYCSICWSYVTMQQVSKYLSHNELFSKMSLFHFRILLITLIESWQTDRTLKSVIVNPKTMMTTSTLKVQKDRSWSSKKLSSYFKWPVWLICLSFVQNTTISLSYKFQVCISSTVLFNQILSWLVFICLG